MNGAVIPIMLRLKQNHRVILLNPAHISSIIHAKPKEGSESITIKLIDGSRYIWDHEIDPRDLQQVAAIVAAINSTALP